MPKAKYPKKSLGSYLLPFLLIIILIATGVYIVKNNINFDDIKRVFQPPPVAKDEKVKIAYQEGENQVKPWSEDKWQIIEEDSYLQVGDSLKTSRSGVLVLRLFEESEIRLSGDTSIKLIRLDKNDKDGNHLAIELVSGKLWKRGKDGNTNNADFIINTNHQVIQMNKTSIVDVSTSPEGTKIIGGGVTINLAQKINGARKPISRIELSAGQEIIIDDLVLDSLKAGEKNVITSISPSYFESEWYKWNLDKEEKLGFLVDPVKEAEVAEELPELEKGLVQIDTPLPDSETGTKILVQGTFDDEKISQIWVNENIAILGLNGEWEYSLTLSEQKNTITVTAQEKDSDIKKQVNSYTVRVDSTGPAFGKVTQPEVDENNNGIIEGDSLELIGEISTDAEKVCVLHNDEEPSYCLKQFSPGDNSYRYLGSINYGNVVKGKNKYTIFAYDQLGNVSQKTIYLFKDEAKPETKIEDSTESNNTTTESSGSDLTKPVITEPDPAVVLQTSENTVLVKGTVDSSSKSLIINGKKADYQAGSTDFEVNLTLEEGENLIKIQSIDSQGNKSKTAVLTVIYLPEEEDDESDTNG